MPPESFTIIEAPSTLGLWPSGVEHLPEALISAGLPERLGARRGGRVEPPPYDAERDGGTLMLNPHGLARYAAALADAVGATLDEGAFPVVLGGDCSILLGNLLALKRRGRYGLLFLDGHADFYQPEAEPKGEAASMELALATGRGPAVVADLEGRGPLVHDEDVIVYGRRDGEQADEHGSQRIEDTGIHVIDVTEVTTTGAGTTIVRALDRLSRTATDGFWIHLDADVLDDDIMPAVDYRMPGGLSWEELTTVLRTSIATGRAAGIDITIFNPRLDPDGTIAARFAQAIAEGMVGSSARKRT